MWLQKVHISLVSLPLFCWSVTKEQTWHGTHSSCSATLLYWKTASPTSSSHLHSKLLNKFFLPCQTPSTSMVANSCGPCSGCSRQHTDVVSLAASVLLLVVVEGNWKWCEGVRHSWLEESRCGYAFTSLLICYCQWHMAYTRDIYIIMMVN